MKASAADSTPRRPPGRRAARSPRRRSASTVREGLCVVVGLGETGLSCVRHLAGRGVPVAATDSRRDPPGLASLRRDFPAVETWLGGLDEDLLAGAARIVVSPGVSRRVPALARAAARGIPVVGDIELFFRDATAPVVAVTGSNGKSTVTAMVGEMLSRAGRVSRLGGNFGPPALDLLAAGGAPDLFVLELSSFQLETTSSQRTRAAALLNVTPDHMDRYPRFEDYVAAKRRVFIGAETLVVNRDDPVASAVAAGGRPVTGFTAGVPSGNDLGLMVIDGNRWLACGGERLLRLNELAVPGLHNAVNALAALALGRAVGLETEPMVEALRRFRGLPHRCRLVSELDGARWYDDSKGTNVGATVAAIAGVARHGPVILIAGGLGKGADFAPLTSVLAERGRAAVLIGAAADEIERAIDGAVPVVRAGDMDEAVAAARGLARPGDSVLLSPACASFDMFDSYGARGDAFVAAVEKAARDG